jgi:DNA-binding GntR family transcriptional regulator
MVMTNGPQPSSRHTTCLSSQQRRKILSWIWSTAAKRHDNFHLCVVSACNSPRLLWIRGVLRSQAERYLNVALAHPLDNDQRMLSRHTQILKAAIERRADDAATLIETDLRSAARHTIPRIRELELMVTTS